MGATDLKTEPGQGRLRQTSGYWLEQDPEFWQEGSSDGSSAGRWRWRTRPCLSGDSAGVRRGGLEGRRGDAAAGYRLAFTEVQTLTLKPGPASGGFRLGVDDARSDPITLLRVGRSTSRTPKPQNPTFSFIEYYSCN
jgi:hypothetical protein